MGANVSTACKHSAAAMQRLQPRANSVPIGGNSSPPGLSIMDLLKPGCLKAEKNKRKRPLTPEKKKMININPSNAGRGKFTTLEEWLLASPVGMNPADFNGSGVLYVLRHYSRTRRVHPASSSRPPNTSLASKAKDNFCLDRFVKNYEKADETNLHNISSTQSGKSKKKVSFRLPEEAKVIIFYPSKEMMSTSSDDRS